MDEVADIDKASDEDLAKIKKSTPSLQLFRPLDREEEAALRASIEKSGVIVPVAVDVHGNILDGHHRVRLSQEMNKQYPVIVIVEEGKAPPPEYLSEVRAAHPLFINHGNRKVPSLDPEAVARTLNIARRHLTVDERKQMVKTLRKEGHSERAIARTVGASQPTVHRDLEAATDSGESVQPEMVVGRDGKARPPQRETPEPKLDIPNGVPNGGADGHSPEKRSTTTAQKPQLLRSLKLVEKRMNKEVEDLPTTVDRDDQETIAQVIEAIRSRLSAIAAHLTELTASDDEATL